MFFIRDEASAYIEVADKNCTVGEKWAGQVLAGYPHLYFMDSNLIRQFSAKMRNICFVLGTLGLLFMFTLVGSSLAFMLSDYQNRPLDVEYPFDIIMISNPVMAEGKRAVAYYDYDVYMGISDYNSLREMLG